MRVPEIEYKMKMHDTILGPGIEYGPDTGWIFTYNGYLFSVVRPAKNGRNEDAITLSNMHGEKFFRHKGTKEWYHIARLPRIFPPLPPKKEKVQEAKSE